MTDRPTEWVRPTRVTLVAVFCCALSSCGFIPEKKPYPQPEQYAEFLDDRGNFVVRFSGDGGPAGTAGKEAMAKVFAAFDRPGRPADTYAVDVVLDSENLFASYSNNPLAPGVRGVTRVSGHRVSASMTITAPTGNFFMERITGSWGPAGGFVGTADEIEAAFEEALQHSRPAAWNRLLGDLCIFLSSHDTTMRPVELALHADQVVATACFEHLREERVRSALALEVIKYPGVRDEDLVRAIREITPWDTDDPAFDALRDRWVQPAADPAHQIEALKFDYRWMNSVNEPDATAYRAEYLRLAEQTDAEVRSKAVANLERLRDELLFGYVDQLERRQRQREFERELDELISALKESEAQ